MFYELANHIYRSLPCDIFATPNSLRGIQDGGENVTVKVTKSNCNKDVNLKQYVWTCTFVIESIVKP